MREVACHPPCYDLGTSRRFAKEMGLVRTLFDGVEYRAGGFNCDRSFGGDACDFHCDLHDLTSIPSQSVGSVICLEVLEHVRDPWRVLAEVFRILKSDGLCVMTVPFLISYHGKSHRKTNPVFLRQGGFVEDSSHSGYGDYWRFTHEGLALAFAGAGFQRVDIWPIDGWLLSRLCLLGLYEYMVKFPIVLRLVARFDRPRLGRATTLHFVRAIK